MERALPPFGHLRLLLLSPGDGGRMRMFSTASLGGDPNC